MRTLTVVNAGVVGLLRAATTFDAERGTPFGGYAAPMRLTPTGPGTTIVERDHLYEFGHAL